MERRIRAIMISVILLLLSQLIFVFLVSISLMHGNYDEFAIGLGFEFVITSIILQVYLYGTGTHES